MTRPPRDFMTNETQVATKARLEGFLTHLTAELDASGFLRNLPKRPGMVRTIRHLFQRGEVTEQELRTLHGIVYRVVAGAPATGTRRGRHPAKTAHGTQARIPCLRTVTEIAPPLAVSLEPRGQRARRSNPCGRHRAPHDIFTRRRSGGGRRSRNGAQRMTDLHWLPEMPDWRARLRGLANGPGPVWDNAVTLAGARVNFVLTNALDEMVRRVMDGPPVGLATKAGASGGPRLPAR